jgi:hypothetical protein
MTLIGTVQLGSERDTEIIEELRQWRDLGATQVNLRTAGVPARAGAASAGPSQPDHHIAALDDIRRRWAAEQESAPIRTG